QVRRPIAGGGGAAGPPPAAGAQSGPRRTAPGAAPVPSAPLPVPLPSHRRPRCPSCPAAVERRLLEEVAKKQLLEKLRLRDRPRLAHSVPRAAVTRALRRLQAGGARRSPDVTGEEEEEQGYEIISFAETDLTSPSSLGLQFQFSQAQDQDIRILQAQLWLYLRVPRASLTLRIFLAGEAGAVAGGNPHSAGGEATEHGGQRLALLPPSCPPCRASLRAMVMAQVNASWSHQPFLVAKVKVREPEHHVAKRSLRCSQNSNLCCRKDYYVDFRDIGWNDWIIKPEGYQINYCVGQCPLHVAGSPGMASSFHTAVLQPRQSQQRPGIGGIPAACPTRRRPLSVLYFDRNSNIVKTDIPDMIVDACGCS
uniref:TGF-beta family profile domain-containing protein n=1 Tax=Catharus ustulatus TaxID=91951 RepID=A0A8C3U9F4_CATUS